MRLRLCYPFLFLVLAAVMLYLTVRRSGSLSSSPPPAGFVIEDNHVAYLYVPEEEKVNLIQAAAAYHHHNLARPVEMDPALVSHTSIFYRDNTPFRLHPEIARVDIFFFSDLPVGMIHYAFWKDACEAPIVNNVQASANWLARSKFTTFQTIMPPERRVALDIGAQQGDTAVLMAPFAILTIALEPHPRIFSVTQTNADINPHLNIHPYNVAASPTGHDYTETWCYGCNGGASNRARPNSSKDDECFEAHLVHVPDFLREHYPDSLVSNIGFIKIDTEGYDTQILLTLKSLLDLSRPTILLEWYHTHKSKKARQVYLDSFAAVGYSPYEMDGVTPIANFLTRPKMRDILIKPMLP